ncbi:MAG: hypothetical protein QM811_30400 [Pirellulales bacterium]
MAEAKQQHELARERYDLAIQTRKTLQEQLVMLEAKIKTEKAALENVTGDVAQPTPTAGGMTVVNGAMTISTVGNVQPTMPTQPTTATSKDAPATAPTTTANGKPPSKELLKAEAVVKKRKDELAAAEREAQAVAERLAALERDIELETKLLAGANKKIEIGRQSTQSASKALERARTDGTPADQMTDLRAQLADAEQMHTRAKNEVARRTERMAAPPHATGRIAAFRDRRAEKHDRQTSRRRSGRRDRRRHEKPVLGAEHVGMDARSRSQGRRDSRGDDGVAQSSSRFSVDASSR